MSGTFGDRTLSPMLFGLNLVGGVGGASAVALAAVAVLFPAPEASSQTQDWGTISGTVTNADGDPLEGICVDAWGAGVWAIETDADGEYSSSVSPGTYKIEFSVCNGGNYVDEWFDDQPDRNTATPVAISTGQTFTADASLATGGRISGTVTDAARQPLEGACASARREQDAFSHFGFADQDGGYVIEGLGSGDYQVFFHHCEAGSYINEYYDDHLDEASADPVPVTSGATTASIDAELATGATISGRVVGLSGQPVENVCVHAHQTEFGLGPFDYTNANGDYTIEGLQTGSYRVVYVPCAPGPYYLEWFDNEADWDSADPVAATVGSITGGIDADLSTRPAGPPSPEPPGPDPVAIPDTIAPAAMIGSGPPRKTTRRRPSFAFSSDDPSAAFECAVDRADPDPCASPIKLQKLKYGKHTFSVAAVDPAANRSPMAQRNFKVIKKKPAKDR
jgi:protocatechuate 3,4-dioxygenase beta subunit